MKKLCFVAVAVLAFWAACAIAAVPQMINYQGELTDGSGNPLDTTVSMEFAIYDDSTGGVLKWAEVHPSVTVTGGTFSVILGAAVPIDDSVFMEVDSWLGITVGTDPEITPRTHFVSVPYAFRVGTVDGATGGIISGDVSIQSDLVVSGKATIGPGHTNTGSNTFVAGSNNTLSGGNSTIGGGTNNTCSGSGNVVAGGNQNEASGAASVTVSGGSNNTAAGETSTIGGGHSNMAGANNATIAGGGFNRARGEYSFIGGGGDNYPGADSNLAAGYASVVTGGAGNIASNSYSAVGGGWDNTANGDQSTVSGGWSNSASADRSTVGGGEANTASGSGSTVGGGFDNEAVAPYSAIGGGVYNKTGMDWTTVGGGYADTAFGIAATVAGGYINVARGYYSAVGGGEGNTANMEYSTIGGGYQNISDGWGSVIGGGVDNTAIGDNSHIGGGGYNVVEGISSTVCGGVHNVILSDYSSIPGGYCDTLGSNSVHSLVFGRGVYLDNPYQILFFDGSNSGRLGLNRDDHDGGIDYPIHVGTDGSNGNGAHLTAGGVWTNSSSREFKENFQALNPGELIHRISEMPIESWNYKDSDERHIGPVAEDFVAAFDVGFADKNGRRENKYLADSDVAGVALAGVKELIAKNQELEDEIAELKALIEQLLEQNK